MGAHSLDVKTALFQTSQYAASIRKTTSNYECTMNAFP